MMCHRLSTYNLISPFSVINSEKSFHFALAESAKTITFKSDLLNVRFEIRILMKKEIIGVIYRSAFYIYRYITTTLLKYEIASRTLTIRLEYKREKKNLVFLKKVLYNIASPDRMNGH